jgi:hypothetical protein
MTAPDLSLLTYSIKSVYWALFIVILALVASFGIQTSVSRKVLLVSGFLLGLGSLLAFQIVKLWILHSSLAVGYGNRVALACACLAVACGILGYRTYSSPWRFLCLILVLYGVLNLLQALQTTWRIYRAGLGS